MVLFKNDEWEIKVMVTQNGNICTCIYFRGMHMGFVNLGDFKTQRMFYEFNCKDLIEQANNLAKK